MRSWKIGSLLLLAPMFSVGCNHASPTAHSADQPAPWLTFTQITEPAVLEGDVGKPIYVECKAFVLDLDGDGQPETLVEDPLSRGNAGVDHSVYRQREGQYEFIGRLFFHRLAIKVLEPTDEYPIRVMRYWRTSGSEGTVDTLGYKDGDFVVIFSETIYPGDGGTDEGRARYAELFGD